MCVCVFLSNRIREMFVTIEMLLGIWSLVLLF